MKASSLKILASIALILALLAAFVGTSERNSVDLEEIARLIETESDHITPLELAEQILSGKKIRLIDLRDSAAHAQRHIFNSELLSLSELMNGKVKRNETIILYSAGGIHASQAWMLLKMKRYDSVYTLLGGFAGWNNEILYPTLLETASNEEKHTFERKKMLSHFFGGEPKIVSLSKVKKKPIQRKQHPAQQQSPVNFQKEDDKLRDGC